MADEPVAPVKKLKQMRVGSVTIVHDDLGKATMSNDPESLATPDGAVLRVSGAERPWCNGCYCKKSDEYNGRSMFAHSSDPKLELYHGVVGTSGVGWVMGNFEYYLLDTPETADAKDVPAGRWKYFSGDADSELSIVHLDAEGNPIVAEAVAAADAGDGSEGGEGGEGDEGGEGGVDGAAAPAGK